MAKRGRINAIDSLPPEADGVVAWLGEEVAVGRLSQVTMLEMANVRLAELGLEPLTRSALNRWIQRGLRAGFRPRSAVGRPAAPASVALCLCPSCGAPLEISARKTS